MDSNTQWYTAEQEYGIRKRAGQDRTDPWDEKTCSVDSPQPDVQDDSPYTTSGGEEGSDTSEEPVSAPAGSKPRCTTFVSAVWDTLTFYRTLMFFFCGGEFKKCPYFADCPQ